MPRASRHVRLALAAGVLGAAGGCSDPAGSTSALTGEWVPSCGEVCHGLYLQLADGVGAGRIVHSMDNTGLEPIAYDAVRVVAARREGGGFRLDATARRCGEAVVCMPERPASMFVTRSSAGDLAVEVRVGDADGPWHAAADPTGSYSRLCASISYNECATLYARLRLVGGALAGAIIRNPTATCRFGCNPYAALDSIVIDSARSAPDGALALFMHAVRHPNAPGETPDRAATFVGSLMERDGDRALGGALVVQPAPDGSEGYQEAVQLANRFPHTFRQQYQSVPAP